MGRMHEMQRQRVKLAGIEADLKRMRTLTSHELMKDIRLMLDKGLGHTRSYERAKQVHHELQAKEADKARQASKLELTR